MGAFWSVFWYNYVMNNFRKCCVFYNHISSWAPATRWGGGGGTGSRRSPLPLLLQFPLRMHVLNCSVTDKICAMGIFKKVVHSKIDALVKT